MIMRRIEYSIDPKNNLSSQDNLSCMKSAACQDLISSAAVFVACAPSVDNRNILSDLAADCK